MNRQEAMIAFVPRIERWAKGYVSKRPGLSRHYQDLVGAANLRMVEKLSEIELENFENFDKLSVYIRLSSRTAFSDFIRKSRTVQEPHSKSKTPCDHLAREPICREEPELSEYDVLEKLLDTVQDARDAKIITAKLRGAKMAKDVAKIVGLSTSTVYRRLKAIKIRYKRHA